MTGASVGSAVWFFLGANVQCPTSADSRTSTAPLAIWPPIRTRKPGGGETTCQLWARTGPRFVGWTVKRLTDELPDEKPARALTTGLGAINASGVPTCIRRGRFSFHFTEEP